MVRGRDSGKIAAAKRALEYIRDGMVIGLGSGTTVAKFVELLGNKVREEGLEVQVVPTSIDSKIMALRQRIRVTYLDEHPSPDIAVDGADEVDPSRNLIKGGGGAMLREKVVDYASKIFIVIVDETKLVNHLCEKRPIPLEVIPFAWRTVIRTLTEEFRGKAILRPCGGGKLGPVVTDNGNFIVDFFPKNLEFDVESIDVELKRIPGVLETGVFLGSKVSKVIVGRSDGTVFEMS